jgi:CRISPR-associated protein Csd1
MILQALCDYYQRKLSLGEIAPDGFITKKIDFMIVVDHKGCYVDIECKQSQKGKRLVGQEKRVPAIGKQAEKHSNSGKDANLLWDKAEFVLGVGKNGMSKNQSFMDTLEKYYPNPPKDVGYILEYLKKEKNKPIPFKKITNHPEYGELISTGAPIVTFKILGSTEPITEKKHVENALSNYVEPKLKLGTCLVTGMSNIPISPNHTVTKGIIGAQTSGANIVSFNKPAFRSYKKPKSLNAPVSMKSAAAYTKALQGLIDSTTNKTRIGDATVVFWAQKKAIAFDLEDNFQWYITQRKDNPDRGVQAVIALYEAVESGKLPLEEGNSFYVLGLSPNAARISVRFWKVGTVKDFAERIKQHFDDLNIIKADYEKPYCTLNELLASTSTETKDSRKPSAVYYKGKFYDVPPNQAEAVIRCVLDGTPYPETLLHQCLRRIRSEVARKDKNGKLMQNVSRPRAAILKAYFNRINRINYHNKKEILMALDPEYDDVGYVLGRLFALLEKIQEQSAKPNRLNSTIRERYYGSFSSSPAVVMQSLMNLKNHHLKKLNSGLRNWYENKLAEVLNLLDAKKIPAHLRLDQQAKFAVGYYHQRIHKDKKENTIN